MCLLFRISVATIALAYLTNELHFKMSQSIWNVLPAWFSIKKIRFYRLAAIQSRKRFHHGAQTAHGF